MMFRLPLDGRTNDVSDWQSTHIARACGCGSWIHVVHLDLWVLSRDPAEGCLIQVLFYVGNPLTAGKEDAEDKLTWLSVLRAHDV